MEQLNLASRRGLIFGVLGVIRRISFRLRNMARFRVRGRVRVCYGDLTREGNLRIKLAQTLPAQFAAVQRAA